MCCAPGEPPRPAREQVVQIAGMMTAVSGLEGLKDEEVALLESESGSEQPNVQPLSTLGKVRRPEGHAAAIQFSAS